MFELHRNLDRSARQVRPIVGILPAAGLGSRIKHLRGPKEILPIAFRLSGQDLQPFPVIEHSLEAMRLAQVAGCFIVISESKSELVKHISDGRWASLDIGYLVQNNPLGLAHAIDRSYPWVRALDGDACLALPDTIFKPVDAIAQVVAELRRTQCELCLGVFPTRTPECLAPVNYRQDGSVAAVYEKPASTSLRNTWGVAAWTPRFTEFLHDHVEAGVAGLSEIFHAATMAKLDVRAVPFSDGSFDDLGTSAGIAASLRRSVDGLVNRVEEESGSSSLSDIYLLPV